MWLPNFGFLFWEPINDSEACRISQSDTSERPFFISFTLEDSLRVRIGDSFFNLPETTQIDQQTSQNTIRIQLEKNDKNRLKSLQCKIISNSYIRASQICYNSITKLFSFLSFKYGSPLAIYSLQAFDEKHNAKWRCYPQFGRSELLQIPLLTKFDKSFRIILSIYREGKNTRSPFYSFLCFYKILEAFYDHRQVFAKSDKIIKDNNLDIKRRRRRITREQLVLSMSLGLWPEFENMAYGKYFNLIKSDYRVKIAHILPTRKGLDWVNLDDFKLFNDFAALSNLTDLVSKDIINDELEIWQKFIDDGIVTL